LKCSSLF